MSCRRICRELLWLTRFGEVGPDSAPHLDHLSACSACRDEVGLDRAMVQQLREALLARVADASPSDTAWAKIVARAQAPEPPRIRLWEWSTALVARLRVATGMAFAAFALILTLNTQLIPAGGVPSSGGSTDAVGDAALFDGIRNPGGRPSRPASGRDVDGRRVAPQRVAPGPVQGSEPFMPPGIGSRAVAVVDEPVSAPEAEPADTFVLVFELIEQPAQAASVAEEVPEPGPMPVDREPGEPS